MKIDNIEHYGIQRRSGRYPWGSGKDPQSAKKFLNQLQEYRKQGMEEKDIMALLGTTRSELRSEVAWANSIRKEYIYGEIQRMKREGINNSEMARRLDISEGSVRGYLSDKDLNQIKQLDNISKALKDDIEKYKYLDIGVGVERQLGISKQKLRNAVNALKEEGYVEHDIYIKRLTDPTKYTTVRVLTKETDLEVVKRNASEIRPPKHWTEDGGLTMLGMRTPLNVDWNRVAIRHKEDGGELKDGVIELRRNVNDLDLGRSNYAQVRIAVGGTHYLKGMAMYSDTIPEGYDIVFNTNKPKGTPKESVLKELKNNKDNPFGATIGPQRGALNIVNEEGDWDSWKSTLSSQFLSKQELSLVKDRIHATKEKIMSSLEEIRKINNPVVKRHLLNKFEDGLTSNMKHLKLLGMERTKGHVILPFPDMKPTEVYAPNYKNGERVVLIRYPHGGTFELPELVVNNKHKSAKSLIGQAHDAIGINPVVAQKLSGADFDGDTVYVVPNNQGKIKTSRSLSELKNFDPNLYKSDIEVMKKGNVQRQMGDISNLITDMTIKGADKQEIARAVRHSMVVIDAYKHKLDYKQSALDNGVKPLKAKYQTYTSDDGKQHVAASTLISRSKNSVVVNGKKISIMETVDDIKKLGSGTDIENAYGDYANSLKALRKQVQDEIQTIPKIIKNKEAAIKYKDEIESLDRKLDIALLNAPKERQAQILAANTYYKNLNPDMSKDEKKKLKAQALVGARSKTNAHKVDIVITDKEWEAIQAHAISNDKLTKIINNSNIDVVRKLATPKEGVQLKPTQVTRIKAMTRNGATQSEIADALGISTNTVKEVLK